MSTPRLLLATLVAALVFSLAPTSASAQGLIWKLPADGTWIRYEGNYKQTVKRPDSTQGDDVLQWTQHLQIQSVGAQQAQYRGKQQPCRWIEIKITTGRVEEGLIDPGPAGLRIYKVLIPESEIRGLEFSRQPIPVAFLPIVKGYRKIGDEEPQPIQGGLLKVFPLAASIEHYKTLKPASDAAAVQTPLGSIDAKVFDAEYGSESPRIRTKNTGKLWISDDTPFGLVKWQVSTIEERKDTLDPRVRFVPSMQIDIEMTAQETGTNAQSELNVQ